MRRSTDVLLRCPCCGAERGISARKMKGLSRIGSPLHEQRIHEIANGNR